MSFFEFVRIVKRNVRYACAEADYKKKCGWENLVLLITLLRYC
jgi:hypothetical protein